MDMRRRNFLKGTAWMGAAALVSGCMSGGSRPRRHRLHLRPPLGVLPAERPAARHERLRSRHVVLAVRTDGTFGEGAFQGDRRAGLHRWQMEDGGTAWHRGHRSFQDTA
ncbi:MAG: twin-arginine translocation signal domain-containing protein [Kiritimatiellae bacterium]|nr:twin-arginine translocation signal domain-containing protein [Kiritimatiellia bacterium]